MGEVGLQLVRDGNAAGEEEDGEGGSCSGFTALDGRNRSLILAASTACAHTHTLTLDKTKARKVM